MCQPGGHHTRASHDAVQGDPNQLCAPEIHSCGLLSWPLSTLGGHVLTSYCPCAAGYATITSMALMLSRVAHIKHGFGNWPLFHQPGFTVDFVLSTGKAVTALPTYFRQWPECVNGIPRENLGDFICAPMPSVTCCPLPPCMPPSQALPLPDPSCQPHSLGSPAEYPARCFLPMDHSEGFIQEQITSRLPSCPSHTCC